MRTPDRWGCIGLALLFFIFFLVLGLSLWGRYLDNKQSTQRSKVNYSDHLPAIKKCYPIIDTIVIQGNTLTWTTKRICEMGTEVEIVK